MAQKNIPTIFVIFGATGDLMTKKLTPALFNLFEKQKLPKLFKIIGVGRRPLSLTEFQNHVTHILKGFRVFKKNKVLAERFLKFFSYHQGNFENMQDYKKLAEILGHIDGEWKVCANKLFYLAVPPHYYETIFQNLAGSGLTIPCGPDEGWTRVLVEKPFGKNAKTAEKLDLLLAKLFKEEQIYRIDHYLAKEMLQNILAFRFSNNLLEESWNNKFIERIDIRLLEKIGVEGRGPFYDGLGAFRDVGQNHLLQMLAFVTMEHPGNFQAGAVRRSRAQVLKTLKEPTAEEIREHAVRAQYRGYTDIQGVRPGSKTETYFRVDAHLDATRWQGVPIVLESGKRMRKAIKEITVTFKHTAPCLCPPGVAEHFQNKVIFSLEPREEITIHFLSKKPGLTMEIEKRTFDFTYRSREKRTQYVEEYEKLLLDCIEGNQLLFLSTAEVAAMWRYTDPYVRQWQKDLVPLLLYRPGSDEILKAGKKMHQKTTPVMRKEVGVVGLGKMGGNISRSLLRQGWKVVGYNRTSADTTELEEEGLDGAYSLKQLVEKLSKPRVIWLMLPAGKPVDDVLFGESGLAASLSKNDIVIDAGNSFYKDTVKRAKKLQELGVQFFDVGFSGGPMGARYGACLMVGGKKTLYEYIYPIVSDLAVAGGVDFFEGVGAGHFVKMVHNGIEYGMMQAMSEGFSILRESKYKLDISRVAEIYNHGSVIESKLVSWLVDGLHLYGNELEDITGSVPRGGEGDWTVKAAHELGLKAKVIEEAVNFRKKSGKNPNYTGKVLNAMRNQFGGHSVE